MALRFTYRLILIILISLSTSELIGQSYRVNFSSTFECDEFYSNFESFYECFQINGVDIERNGTVTINTTSPSWRWDYDTDGIEDQFADAWSYSARDNGSFPQDYVSNYVIRPVDETPSCNYGDYFPYENECNRGDPRNGPTITINRLQPIVGIVSNSIGRETVCPGEQVTLNATTGWPDGRYKWYYRTSSGGSWTRISGKSNSSAAFTASDFPSNLLDRRITLGVAIGSVSCSECNPSNMFSPVTDDLIFLSPPPGIADFRTLPPTCPGGTDGGFVIEFAAGTPAGTNFKYSIQQLIPSSGGCDANPHIPSSFNSLTFSDLSTSEREYIETNFSNTQEFCSGFIGNFQIPTTGTDSAGRSIVVRTANINQTSTEVTESNGNQLLMTAGIYRVTVESTESSCFETIYFEVAPSEYQNLLFSSSVQDNTPSCAGIAEGAVNITLNRGLGTLNWTLTGGSMPLNGSTTSRVISTPNSLEHGINYSLSVTDQCESYPNLRTISLTNDGPELNPVLSKMDPSCIDSGGSNGSVTVTTPSGAAGKNYTYTLFIPNGSINTPDQQIASINVGTSNRTHTFNNLDTIEYYVRASAPGCDNDNSNRQTLAAPASFGTSITRGTITPVACATGGNDGSVVLSNIAKAADDDISLQYTISGGGLSSPRTDTISRSDLSSEAYTIAGLPSGNGYSISLIDLCKGNEPVTLSNPTNFNITRPQPIALTDITDKTIACFETPTTIDINISEGTAPFIVNIFKKNSDTDSFDQPAFFTDNSVQRSELPLQVAGLAVGDYRVEVTSGSPCTADDDFDEFTISAGNATAALSATITKRVDLENGLNLDCNADYTGQLTVVVSGGVRDGADEYNLVLTDNNNIPFTDDATIGNTTPTISSGNFNSSAGTVTYTISDLTSGIAYRVRITDSNSTGSCVKTFSTDNLGNNLSLSQPDVLELRPVTVDQLANEVEEPSASANFFLQCNGDNNITYTAQLRGGNQPYHVSLFRKDTASATSNYSIERGTWDRPGINATSVAFTGLGMGDYRVTLNDVNNCTQSVRFFTINETEALGSSADTLEYAHGFNVRCIGDSNGSITLFATGGLKPYTFDLFRDGSLLSSLAQEGNTSQRTFPGLAALNGATPYEYTWRVVDQLGCVLNSTDLADGRITLRQPTQVEVDTSFISFITPDFEVPCKNEAARIQFTASGGHLNGDYDVFLTSGDMTNITAVSADNANGIFVFDLLAANDYQVFVRDGLSCQSATMNFVIREPATLIDTVSTVVTPPVCIGGSTATINVVATGGTPDTNPANAYTFEIKESSQPDADYRLSDSDNGISATFSGLDALGINLGSAGNKDYDIRITDANGCDEVFTVTMVPNPNPLELVITNTVDPSCAGGDDGSISVQVSNADATGNLTYYIKGGHLGTDTLTFDDPGTTFTFTQLQDNQIGLPYTVWVSDDNNCVDLVNQVKDTRLAEPTPVTINTLQARRPSCWDGIDGSIIVKMDGGIAPYQISFNNGPFTPVNPTDSIFRVFSLEADTYNFRVRDANYNPAQAVCTISKDIVVEPGRTFDFSVLIEDVSCFSGSDGAIDLATDIGNRDEPFDPARLTLTWFRNSPAGQAIGNDEDLAAISAGSYFLKAEYDLDSVVCDTLFSYPVLQPASPFVISSFVNNGTTCGISDEGSIRFSVDGGYPGQFAYYNIDDTGWNIISSPNKTVIVSGIMAGDHQLKVGQIGNPTDGFECSDFRNFSIDNRAFTIEATISTPVICNGETATVTLSSDTPDLHYALVGGDFENSSVFNLPAGDYQFIARKSNLVSCVSEILNLTITQPDPITIDPFITQNADCGQNNGTVTTTVSGGAGPVTMQWTDLNGNPVNPDALITGDYQLNVSDSIGCRKTFGPFNIADNPTIGLGYVINTPADCSAANGRATLTITGGIAPFIVNDSIFNDPVITLTNLPAVDSVFNVSDARNCPQDITVSMPGQNTLTVTASQIINTTCNQSNGSMTVLAENGLAPYAYQWVGYDQVDGSTLSMLSPGNYTVIVTDANGCSFSLTESIVPTDGISQVDVSVDQSFCGLQNGQININSVTGDFPPFRVSLQVEDQLVDAGSINSGESLAIPNIGQGTFAIVVTDANNCPFPVSGIEVADDVTKNFSVQLTISDSSACNNASGTIIASITDGLAPFSFQWMDQNDQPIAGDDETISMLAAGNYALTVTDANGCTAAASILMSDRQNPVLTVSSIIASPIGAANGSVQFSASGGTGEPYTFSLEGQSNQAGLFTGLAPGSYSATAIDRLGCPAEPVSFVVSGTDQLQLSILSTIPATCSSAANGQAQLSASGGIAPYTFSWNGNSGDPFRDDLLAGAYQVIVTDAIDSKDTVTFDIDILEAVVVEPITTPASCTGTCDGVIELFITGGSNLFDVSWDNGMTGNTINQLCPGTYAYTITDRADNSCITTGSVELGQFEDIAISLQQAISPTCHMGSDAAINIEVSGGSSSYSFLWSNGMTEQNISGLTAGSYAVTVTDIVLGCSESAQFVVEPTLPITLVGAEITQPNCPGESNGQVIITLENTEAPLITWDNGQIGPIATNLAAGTHAFSVVDRNGCTLSSSVTIEDRQQLVIDQTVVNASCFGFNDGSVDLQIDGGTPPFFIQWSNGARTNNIQNLGAGTYTYTVSDAFNCTVSSSVNVLQPDQISITAEELIPVSCFSGNDGAINVTVTGGDNNYTFSWRDEDDQPIADSEDLSELSVGLYSLTVNDGNGCIGQATFTINQPEPIRTTQVLLIDPACPKATDGSIELEVTGGTPPYNFSWADDENADSNKRQNLAAGNYQLTITDDNGCSLTRGYTLTDPQGLEIANETITQPSCFNSNDGAISPVVIGGATPYAFQWSSGQTDADIDQLPAGEYTVTVTDALGCMVSKSYTLNNPDELFITGISDFVLLCEGGTVKLEPDTQWQSYQWSGPAGANLSGFSETTAAIQTGVGGEYTLNVTDRNGCPASFTTFLEVSDNALQADFLRISEAVPFEPMIFVDISIPIPDVSEWIIPDDDNIIINETNPESVELVFTATGDYQIGMRVRSNDCESEIFKTITISESAERINDDDRDQNPAIKVKAFPNPATDFIRFNINVEDESPVNMILMSNLTARKIKHQKVEGKKDYLVEWNVADVKPGVYQLYINHNNTIATKRILIQR